MQHPFLDPVMRRCQKGADRLAVIDGAHRITRGQLLAQAQRLGAGLLRLGLRSGDAVAFQLPNWHEACAINLAAALHGLRLVPLLPMYRESELRLMLQATEARAIFVPAQFRGTQYPALLARVRGELPALRHVIVVRGAGEPAALADRAAGPIRHEDLLAHEGPLPAPTPAGASDIKMVLYTSGSTGRPKGVLHTHAGIAALNDFVAGYWSVGEDDVALVPSPVGHIGGSMYAFDLPWVCGWTAVLMDSWDAAEAVRIAQAEGVSFCAGATPFLQGLLQASVDAGTRLPRLRRFICGGASVPPELVLRAAERFQNCVVSRAYGSTEVPVICPGVRSRADALHGATTDGECRADVRFLDDAGAPVPPGKPGEIVARAPRMFAGYLDAADNEGAYTTDGYFRLGDIGRLVDGRYIEITGRKKELIIRQGENISPLEIENALLSHPAVRQVAVVGVPDARTGEAALACVVLHEGAHFDMAVLREFLQERGLARPKWPEHLRVLDALPTNAIGKVQKRELRDRFTATPRGGVSKT